MLPDEITEFFSYKHDLSIADDLVLRGDRVLVPRKMRQSILTKLHCGHIGINGTIGRARETVFWPNINDHIKQMI